MWAWWKLKKWALRIVSHFIQRYGNPRYSTSEHEAFAEYFKSHVAGPLLGPVMNCLALKAQGTYTARLNAFTIAFCLSPPSLIAPLNYSPSQGSR